MEAKDTVMTLGAIVVNLKWSESWVKDHRKGFEKLVNEQAEISFKAGYHQREIDPLDKEDRCEKCYEQGIKEVVDWINLNGLGCSSNTPSNKDEYIGFHKPSWQAKLKKWGIKED